MTSIRQWLTVERNRAWLYRLSVAAIAILVAYGVLTDEQAPLVIGLLAAMFPAGLASANTTTKTPEQPPPTIQR